MPTELSSFVGYLPAAEGVSLMIDANFKYEPALGMTNAPVFKAVTRVSKKAPFAATYIKKSAYNATPVDGLCDRSGFGQGNKEGLRKIEFQGQYYDYSGELCSEDFQEYCGAWEQGVIFRMQNPSAAFAQNELLQVVFGIKYQAMVDDVQRIVWYATEDAFAVDTAAGAAPFYIGEVPNRADIMLGGKQDGFWALAKKNVAASRTPFVDTNDGSAGGNILNQANVYSMLQRFVQAATPELRRVPKGLATSPFFLVDNAVFEALRNYQTSNGVNTNNVAAWTMQQNGQEVLQLDGYMVYRDNNSDAFDSEIGAKKTSTIGGKSITHSRNCRVLFTAAGTASLGLDMATPVGDNIGLIVAPAADQVKNAGYINWKMMTSVGMVIGEPSMMVVGYPSNANTWV
jgi:hypothetical protein